MASARAVRTALLALAAFVGLNALVAGGLLVARPDGSALGLPQDDLRDTPFATFLVPGLLLVGLGLAHGGAFALQLRRHRLAWLASGFAGGYLVVWILVQVTMIQWSFLQPALFALGAAQGLLALVQVRQRRASGPA